MLIREKIEELVVSENNIVDADMISVSFDFWFNDHEEIRSPFPDYIKEELINNATKAYVLWVKKLSAEAKKEINDEIMLEKFEEILFEDALKLCITDDEKISVKYPFMPRLGDTISHENQEGRIIFRHIRAQENQSFLDVEVVNPDLGTTWKTSFELAE